MNCFSQAGEWVWVKGDTVTNNMGTYGVQGVSNINNYMKHVSGQIHQRIFGCMVG